jgi:hypothetical protein
MNFSITNINRYSRSFDFLIDEPDIYNKKDLLKLIPRKKDE